MKKILPICIVGILILSGLGAVAIPHTESNKTLVETITLSEPTIVEKDNYATIDLTGATSYLMETGNPVLPVITKVYKLPFKSEVTKVIVTFSDVATLHLSEKIRPAPQPIPLASTEIQSAAAVYENLDIYSQSECYPAQQYTYSVAAGRDDNQLVNYLRLHCYPVQYSPGEDILYYAKSMSINIQYTEPTNPLTLADTYQLVIITPETFQTKLQPLVDFKNSKGMNTTLMTLEQIYSDYTGVDNQEKIKYFIKYALDTYGIKYVMLVGGRKGQTLNWYFPVRETNNDDGSGWEIGTISDLYYADIYDSLGNFSSWDTNGDGIFAKWSGFIGKLDIIDYVPDVFVGRLGVTTPAEVDFMVQKIIDYETTAADPSWFEKVIVVAGDTFPPQQGGEYGDYEGELETNVTAAWFQSIGYTVVKLWTSLGTLTGETDVIDAINEGAGFMHFAGHGNPSIWSSHPPDNKTWVDGLTNSGMNKLKNGGKAPVVVVGGCHNSQFNVTLMNIKALWIEDIKKAIAKEGSIIKGLINGTKRFWTYTFWLKEWVPECWSWYLITRSKGGAIGTMGNTGLGYGYENEYTTEGLGGWIEPRFFDAYANQSKHNLGAAHSQAITDYVNIIDGVNSDQIDRKTVEQWALLGDPSLMLGGYSS